MYCALFVDDYVIGIKKWISQLRLTKLKLDFIIYEFWFEEGYTTHESGEVDEIRFFKSVD